MNTIPNLNGDSRIYALFGDPIAQVLTPSLINPVFAQHKLNMFAVPFHVTASMFEVAWQAFTRFPNVAGLALTVPHKIVGAQRCDRLTRAAESVGVVNTVRRESDGTMYGALFDGEGFVLGLGERRSGLRGASVILVGAGGAGRAIAHALCAEGIGRLHVADLDATAVEFAVSMVNRECGREIATRDVPDVSGCQVLINASPVGLRPHDVFPVPLDGLDPSTLVADIASMTRRTELLVAAENRGCATSDGRDMLKAQIGLVAGFIAGMPAGVSIDDPR